MKKKILFIDYIFSSTEDLKEYYYKNLESKYGDQIKIINYQKPFSKELLSLTRFISKRWHRIKHFRKPDVVIGDSYTYPIFKYSKNSIYIFHGAVTKRHPAKNDNPNYIQSAPKRAMDYVVGFSSKDQDKYMLDTQGKPAGKFELLPYGLPRNDKLFDTQYKDQSRDYFNKKYNLQGKKILLYAPTFRNFDFHKLVPFKAEDFQRLNIFLEKNNWVMFYRPHSRESIIPKNFLEGKDAILTLDSNKEQDTQQILAATDMLITDYSSIFVDYLIMDRPIAFMPFDLDLYEDTKGLVMDFNDQKQIPGPILMNMNQIIDLISDIEQDRDKFTDCREQSKRFYFDNFDGDSCKRIWDFILKQLLKI